MLKLDTLRATPVEHDPYDYLIVRNFVDREKLKEVLADYPDLEPEDVRQALQYAAWLAQEEVHIP